MIGQLNLDSVNVGNKDLTSSTSYADHATKIPLGGITYQFPDKKIYFTEGNLRFGVDKNYFLKCSLYVSRGNPSTAIPTEAEIRLYNSTYKTSQLIERVLISADSSAPTIIEKVFHPNFDGYNQIVIILDRPIDEFSISDFNQKTKVVIADYSLTEIKNQISTKLTKMGIQAPEDTICCVNNAEMLMNKLEVFELSIIPTTFVGFIIPDGVTVLVDYQY